MKTRITPSKVREQIKNKVTIASSCKGEGDTRGDTPRVSPSRAPVLSCAHHSQAPATQASKLTTVKTP